MDLRDVNSCGIVDVCTTASNLDRLGTDVGSALLAMKAEKSRLVRLKLERQAQLHSLYDRATECFQLLNTKPEAQRAVFTWHQRALLPQSLVKLKEVRVDVSISSMVQFFAACVSVERAK